MGRLTKWNGKKWILPQGMWREIADRLAAYENTGLEPEEIVMQQNGDDLTASFTRIGNAERASVERICLSRREVAEQLGISLPTLLQLTQMDGGIPHFFVGRRPLYPRQELEEWVRRQAQARKCFILEESR